MWGSCLFRQSATVGVAVDAPASAGAQEPRAKEQALPPPPLRTPADIPPLKAAPDPSTYSLTLDSGRVLSTPSRAESPVAAGGTGVSQLTQVSGGPSEEGGTPAGSRVSEGAYEHPTVVPPRPVERSAFVRPSFSTQPSLPLPLSPGRRWEDAASAELEQHEWQMTTVLPWLYLSGASPAGNARMLAERRVTLVINCAGEACRNAFESEEECAAEGGLRRVSYLTFCLRDGPFEDISGLFAPACAAIEAARAAGDSVLVHCHQGVSRSASVVAAYLMWAGGLTWPSTYAYLRAARRIVSPNAGFMVALMEWGAHCAALTALPAKSPPPSLLRLQHFIDGCYSLGPLFERVPTLSGRMAGPSAERTALLVTLRQARNTTDRAPIPPCASVMRAWKADICVAVTDARQEGGVTDLQCHAWMGVEARAVVMARAGIEDGEEAGARMLHILRTELAAMSALFHPLPHQVDVRAAVLEAVRASGAVAVQAEGREFAAAVGARGLFLPVRYFLRGCVYVGDLDGPHTEEGVALLAALGGAEAGWSERDAKAAAAAVAGAGKGSTVTLQSTAPRTAVVGAYETPRSVGQLSPYTRWQSTAAWAGSAGWSSSDPSERSEGNGGESGPSTARPSAHTTPRSAIPITG